MIRIGDFVTTCRSVEVQDDAVALPLFDRLMKGDQTEGLLDAYQAARKQVWRVETFVRGLSFFRPVLHAQGLWDDFESEAEARACLVEVQVDVRPMSLCEAAQVWVHELTISFRDCTEWLRFRARQLRRPGLEVRLP